MVLLFSNSTFLGQWSYNASEIFKWSFLYFAFSQVQNFWLQQTGRFLHQNFQVSNIVKQENFNHNNPQRFYLKLFNFVYSQIQNFNCKKPQRLSIELFEFLEKWNLKSVKVWQRIYEVFCSQRSWEIWHTPHLTGRCPWNPFILPVYEQNTKHWSFCSFLFMFLRIVFLKFSHMSDDGSEIDSKYNIHPSFVIVIWFKS